MKKKAIIFVFMAIFLMIAAAVLQVRSFKSTHLSRNHKPVRPPPTVKINVPGVSIQVYASGLNPMVNTPDEHGSPAGIWLGLWHGIISPVIIVLSFFHKNVQMYEVHNDGNLYNLGFFLGVFMWAAVIGLLIGRR